MKAVVFGGTGMIGRPVVACLEKAGHDVVVATRSTGVNAQTGEGVSEVLSQADVLIDVTNVSSYDEAHIRQFFSTAAENLSRAAQQQNVPHYLLLSIVGVDRIPDSPYMQAIFRQEQIIRESGIHATILRATQFFEFLPSFAEFFRVADTIRLPAVWNQAVALQDVAELIAELVAESMVRAADQAPSVSVLDLAGPEKMRLAEMVQNIMKSSAGDRPVVEDPAATYFGAQLQEDALIPLGNYRAGTTQFHDWLQQPARCSPTW